MYHETRKKSELGSQLNCSTINLHIYGVFGRDLDSRRKIRIEILENISNDESE